MSAPGAPDFYAAPFSPASKPGVPFASCDAYRTLLRQIRGYARGETTGQSVLMAGHRGSGKTTVTMHAIEEIQREWAAAHPSDTICCSKPFPVYLHGPDLLANPGLSHDDRMRHVLTEITRSLHRAFAKEIADQFRIVLSRTGRESIELAHRVRLELDGFPAAGHLRQCWDAAGVLKQGLFPMRPMRDGAALGSASPDHQLLHPEVDQGMREIVAIHSLTCVRRALGDDPDGDAREATPAAPASGPSRESLTAFSPLASLGSGLAVALLGIGAKEFSAATAAAAGLATTAISYLFLHLATAPSRSQTLLSHNEVASLNRALPALIARIRNMGLVPIFVVDELDKVPDLAAFFTWVIKHGKGVLTDQVFCCYLVDRLYYEQLCVRMRPLVYPVESTFFEQRALIHYGPENLIDFARSTWQVFSEKSGWSREAVLRFAVLMSGCHPGNLQQVRDTYTGEKGLFCLPAGPRADTGIAIAVLMQVAIEFVFRQQGTRQRLRLEAGFAHTVLDVLYYPARCWTTEGGDGSELAVSSDALAAYLLRHTGVNYASEALASEFRNLERRLTEIAAYLQEPKRLLDEVKAQRDRDEAEAQRERDEAAKAQGDRDEAAKAQGEPDGAAKAQGKPAGNLDNKPNLYEALEGTVASLFQSNARIPLERIPERPGVLRWRFDQFGSPLTPCARMEALERELPEDPETGDITLLADWVVAFDQAVRDLSGKVKGAAAPLGLVALLSSVVASPENLSWESAIAAARTVRARQSADRADVLLLQVWNAAHWYSRRLRLALIGALLTPPPGDSLDRRLKVFVEANRLQPGPEGRNEDQAYDGLGKLVGERSKNDEVLSTLYSHAVRYAPLQSGLWLQTIRGLAAHLRLTQSRPEARQN